MSDLWEDQRQQRRDRVKPLPATLRPRTLQEFVGQRHLLDEGKLLRRMIDADRLTSVIFTGPPGTGKTSLAEVIANHTRAHFERAHAASIGVKDIRAIIENATARIDADESRTILFLDEIHRFARNQQDVLLDAVERGLITLIGATTENPYFSINSALVSRSTVFRFEPLTEGEIIDLLRRALRDERAFDDVDQDIIVNEDALARWATICDGDARRALAALEVAVMSQLASSTSADNQIVIDVDVAEESMQQKAAVYEGTGDAHYDVISAFIKSMRGSDPDAAVYWLARMLHAGEDPRFIARRIAILASEDIGNADPNALRIAAASWELTERIGMPECQLTLAQAAIYMAVAPKSNASAKAIWDTMKVVEQGRTIEVPIALRDPNSTVARTPHSSNTQESMKPSDDSSRTYRYPHDFADGYVVQAYLGVDMSFYQPTTHGVEARIRERLNDIKGRRTAHNLTSPDAENNDDSSRSED